MIVVKNTASQKVRVQAIDRSTGGPKTGDAANITVYVNKDWAGANSLTDTSATEISSSNDPGSYLFDLTQAETNATVLGFSGKSSTSNVDIVPFTVKTSPPNLELFSIDSSGYVGLQTSMRAGIRKNTAYSNFPISMTDSTNHAPASGKTVSVTRSIDGAAFAAGTIGAVTELSSGTYYFNLGAGDLNGDFILILATASGCDNQLIVLKTNP